jgi:hypothetical protein
MFQSSDAQHGVGNEGRDEGSGGRRLLRALWAASRRVRHTHTRRLFVPAGWRQLWLVMPRQKINSHSLQQLQPLRPPHPAPTAGEPPPHSRPVCPSLSDVCSLCQPLGRR